MTKINSSNTAAAIIHEFEQDQLEIIRNALLIGLASYGELERIIEKVKTMEFCGHEIHDLNPLHPTGSADTVSVFADALMIVNR